MSSAEEKFWASQDLVEQLMPFLDAHSASNLASVHPLTIKILESAPVWSKLIRRTCRYNNMIPVGYPFSSRMWFEEAYQEQRTEVQQLVKIL